MKTITITVEGGVIQDIKGIPEDVEVRVLDFDIEGCSENELEELVTGQKFREDVYRC